MVGWWVSFLFSKFSNTFIIVNNTIILCFPYLESYTNSIFIDTKPQSQYAFNKIKKKNQTTNDLKELLGSGIFNGSGGVYQQINFQFWPYLFRTLSLPQKNCINTINNVGIYLNIPHKKTCYNNFFE